MAKTVGLNWAPMTLDEALDVDKPPPVEPLEAWSLCPSCGCGGYHHLGVRRHVSTGRPVQLAQLAEHPAADFVDAGTTEVRTARVDTVAAVETREHISRECLYCEHRWSQATGVVGTHVPTFEDALRDSLLAIVACASIPRPALRDPPAGHPTADLYVARH